MRGQGKQTQQDVLGLLKQSPKPMTAYDILAELKTDNAKLAPPTIYRALSALTDQGLIHRVEGVNAFVACCHGDHDAAALLSICEDCGGVEERVDDSLSKVLRTAAIQTGFKTKRQVIEIYGVCSDCGSAEVTS